MVRNTKGGNKSKKGARKNLSAGSSNIIRYAEEDCEIYASVVRVFGGDICQVKCGGDGLTRQCVIRKKFRGRNRMHNRLQPGVWVLVGLREWENKNGETQKCDLLEVYNDMEKEKLKQTLPNDILPHSPEMEDNHMNNHIEFVNEETMMYTDMLDKEFEKKQNETNNKDEKDAENYKEEIISIDDI